MKELSVKDLPTFPNVKLTGELGIAWQDGRWERNGQQLIGPISKLILEAQPDARAWMTAAIKVTGWTSRRVLAFQSALAYVRLNVGLSQEGQKGNSDATIYRLLYKMAKAKQDHHPSG